MINKQTIKLPKKRYGVPKQFLGAFKCGHRVSAQEFIDDEFAYELLCQIYESDWTNKEAIQQLEYLTKFNNEFHKNVVLKNDQLHTCKCLNRLKGDEHENDCLRDSLNKRENARNRDITSIYKDNIVSIDNFYDLREEAQTLSFLDMNRDLSNHENTLIDLITSEEFKNSKRKDKD